MKKVKFEDLTLELLHKLATTEEIFILQDNEKEYSAIFNEGLGVFKLFEVGDTEYKWLEISIEEL
jgi:hypothetical protein